MARQRKQPGFADWIEKTVHLPLGLAAEPGLIVLPPYLREVAGSMVDPAVKRLTIMKSARIGYSTLLSSLVAMGLGSNHATLLPGHCRVARYRE